MVTADTEPAQMENACRKAYTARSFRTSTAAYAKQFADNDPAVRQQVACLPNVIAIPGGLPIRVGDDVIGGAAVSGSPRVDEPCVQAGLDKVCGSARMSRSGGGALHRSGDAVALRPIEHASGFFATPSD